MFAASRRLLLAARSLSWGSARWWPPGPPTRCPGITIDWAYYNPVSLVLKDKGWLGRRWKAAGRVGDLGAGAPAATRRSSS